MATPRMGRVGSQADVQIPPKLIRRPGGNDLRLKGRAAAARLAIVGREEPSVPDQSVERKLAAIFAADKVSGYTTGSIITIDGGGSSRRSAL